MTGQQHDPIDFAKPPPGPTARHKVTLIFNVVQNGQPFMNQSTDYFNCTDAHVAAITGMTADMAGALGTQGQKPKNQQFDITLTQKVDDAVVATGTWQGLSREYAIAFERHVLQIWLHGNDQTTITNKALGKI
jgi:hypothetical protein